MLTACNWMQMLAFRAQMRSIDEFTVWEDAGEPTFVFKRPLLTLADLHALGVYPELRSEVQAVLRYRRAQAPSGTAVDLEFRLQFSDGKLAGLVFPDVVREALGRGNIRGLFAMIGDADAAGAGIGPLPREQLIAAGLFNGEPDTLGREIELVLVPLDPRNRSIVLKMLEADRIGYYTDFHLTIKRPGGE